jgi:hypothetical protein
MRATRSVCGTAFVLVASHVALAEPTRVVNDSVGDGATEPEVRPDSLRFALGLAGSFALLAQDSVGTAGAILDLHYEMSRLEAGFDLRVGGASSGSNASGSGLGAYAGAGIETLRTHHGHLAVGIRLDVPFFALNESGMIAGDNAGRGTIFRGPQTTYYAPLTLETRLTF